MQIKYATVVFSAVFLLLQASTPMVDAIPTEKSRRASGFSVYKRQVDTKVETSKQIIDQAFSDYDTCMTDVSPSLDVNCLEKSFDTIFVNSLTEAVSSDDTVDEQENFRGLVGDMIGNAKMCMMSNYPGENARKCLSEFHDLLVEVAIPEEAN